MFEDQPPHLRKYVEKVQQLDGLLAELTRDYCADECPHNHGCCQLSPYTHYAFNVPKELLQMQKEESENFQGDSPCKYHSAEGCKLTSTKSPLCLGYLCSTLVSNLEDKYGRFNTKAFQKHLQTMSRLGLCGSHSLAYLFTEMDQAIVEGQKLITLKKEREEVR